MPKVPDAEAFEMGSVESDAKKVLDATDQGTIGGAKKRPGKLAEGVGVDAGADFFATASAGSSFATYATPASGDSANVDTAAIRLAAETGAAHVGTIDQLIAEMQQQMAASDSVWTGEASAWYRDAFATGSAKSRKALEEYVLFTNELVSYADEYEQVDSRAQAIAEGVAQPGV